MRNIFVLTCLVSFSGCNSLIDETARVEKAYELKAGLVPQVSSTDPADNTFAPITQTYVDVVFSNPINVASFSAQSTFGACSGTFQLSYDGFNNCIAGTVDVSANPRIRFTPTVFPKGLGLQIRVVGVLSPAGNTVATYTSAIGFRLAAPCGNQNCFFSYSTPLTHLAATLSGVFRIRTGTNAGKYLVYSASGSATTLIDPLNGNSEVGPTLCFVATNGSADFYISSGTHAGKQMILRGAGQPQTCLFDPLNDATPFSAGPNLTIGANNGAFVVQPGTGFDTDNTLIFPGGGNQMMRYTAAGGTIATVGSETMPASVTDRGHAVQLTTGSDIGKFLVFPGIGSNQKSLLDPGAIGTTLTTSPGNTTSNLSAGALSFEVTSGISPGRIITLLGASSASNVFSTSALASAPGTGPSLVTGTVGAGALLLKQSGNISATRPLIINAGGSGHATNYFDAESDSFVAGPMTTGAMGQGSAAAWVPAAQGGGGGFLIVNGISGASTSIYLPHNNTFHGSRMPTNVPNSGANAFRIRAGSNSGKTLIVGGNATAETAVFDPLTYQMSRGPTLTGNATSNAFNMPLTRGNNAGAVVVFHGGTAYSVYNPSSLSFTTGGFPFTAAINAGAQAFAVENSPNIIIVRGGSSTADIYNQETNLLGTPLPVGFLVGGDPIAIRYVQPSTSQVKTMIFTTSTTMRIFDHATQAFNATFALGSAGGAGIKGFVIPSGTHAGKVVIMRGGGNPDVYMMNNEDNSNDATVPVAAGCTPVLNAGSQVLPITTGANAGKMLVLFGGNSRSSCLYEPADHRFVAGPNVGNVPSSGFQLTTGSVAFATGGGLYPTSFVVISGSLKNVWSTYVP